MNCPELTVDRWNVSEEEYRAYPALNFHTLANFKKDPRLWREGFFNDIEENDAMRFGTAMHARLLEGLDAYKKKIAVFYAPRNPNTSERFGATTKAFKEEKAAFLAANVGKTVIDEDDERTIERLLDAFRFHPVAPALLGRKHKTTELAIKCKVTVCDCDKHLKGRIDCYSDAGLVDIKTTQQLLDASGRDRFRYAVYDYGYILQLAFYNVLLNSATNVVGFVPWWLVALEKSEPYRVAVYRIAPNVQESAVRVVWNWLEAFVKAEMAGIYESRCDAVQLIDQYNPEKDLL